MYELRYLVRNGWDGPEKVLQYRTKREVTDYSTLDGKTGGFSRKTEWTEWQDVPIVKDK
jgi:hypothetical protein